MLASVSSSVPVENAKEARPIGPGSGYSTKKFASAPTIFVEQGGSARPIGADFQTIREYVDGILAEEGRSLDAVVALEGSG